MTEITSKQILLQIIKQQGNCCVIGVLCKTCPLASVDATKYSDIYCCYFDKGDNVITYKKAVKLFINLYGKDELVGELL